MQAPRLFGLALTIVSLHSIATHAAVWTNVITSSPQNWNVAGNWMSPAAYPNGNVAIAYITNDIPGDQTINLNALITNGSLTLGDTSSTHSFTLAASGGTLTFQNNGSEASLIQTPTSKGD